MLTSALGITNHTTVSFTKDEGIGVIPEVIEKLETHDPNTIRASIPMYLLAKHIRENTDFKVILSGEGADELFMGYNYFAIMNPTSDQAKIEATRLTSNLHSFDLLRAERCFSTHGLELRVPFLDKDHFK
jgi:asparagine synthase (glutamine-hydrolysing)